MLCMLYLLSILISKGPTTTSSAIFLVPFTKFFTIIFYYHISCYFMLCICICKFEFEFGNKFIHSFIHIPSGGGGGSPWPEAPQNKITSLFIPSFCRVPGHQWAPFPPSPWHIKRGWLYHHPTPTYNPWGDIHVHPLSPNIYTLPLPPPPPPHSWIPGHVIVY